MSLRLITFVPIQIHVRLRLNIMFSTVQKQSSFEFLEVPDVPGSEGATSSSKEVRSYTVVFEYDTFRVRFL